jgi:hypothetical protein
VTAVPSGGRLLFPFRGATLSRAELDAALELAHDQSATLVPAYLAVLPAQLSPDAPIVKECKVAVPLLEAVEQRAARLGVPVDARLERGRTPREALERLLEHERFDRIVIPPRTARSAGFAPDLVSWLLEQAPGRVVVSGSLQADDDSS